MAASIDTLLALMAALRDPERGCPWDVAQTFASIVPYTLEEAYEVADAVERGDLEDLRDELGDLLLQVVFHARMAEETGAFAFQDVAAAIVRKLIRRHPHVFDAEGRLLPPGARAADPAEVEAAWARIKAEERAERQARRPAAGAPAAPDPLRSRLVPVPRALPALVRADKVSRQAAALGFDWDEAGQVLAKVREEVAEVEALLGPGAADAPADPGAAPDGGARGAKVFEEIGDLLFAAVNLARHAGVDPEAALHGGTRKFERRFAAMSVRLAEGGHALADSDLATMEAAWQAVKRAEGEAAPEEGRPRSPRPRSS